MECLTSDFRCDLESVGSTCFHSSGSPGFLTGVNALISEIIVMTQHHLITYLLNTEAD